MAPLKLGKHCNAINITPDNLMKNDLPKLEKVSNGVIVEMCGFSRQKKMKNDSVGNWLRAMGIEQDNMDACLWTMFSHKKELNRLKKVDEIVRLFSADFDADKWFPLPEAPTEIPPEDCLLIDKSNVLNKLIDETKDLQKKSNSLQHEI